MWAEFFRSDQIEGIAGFAVPLSGPALMHYTNDGETQTVLCVDPDVGPRIVVCQHDDDGNMSNERKFDDTPEGYALAKEYAESLL